MKKFIIPLLFLLLIGVSHAWFDFGYTSRYINNITYVGGTTLQNFSYVLNSSQGFDFGSPSQRLYVWGLAERVNSTQFVYFNSNTQYILVNGSDNLQLPTEIEVGNGTSYTPTLVWDNNFKAVWHLTNVNDSTNNSKAITITGGSITNGKIGYGYSNIRGNKTSDTDLNSNPFTIEAWVNFSALGWQMLVAKAGGSSDGDAQFLLEYSPVVTFCTESGQFAFVIRSVSQWNCAQASPNNGIQTGKWYYVVGTFDGTNLRIYVNGVLYNTTAIVNAYQTTGTDLFFGRRGVSDALITGTLDEVRFSNVNRSSNYTIAVNKSLSITFSNFSATPELPSASIACGATNQTINFTIYNEEIPNNLLNASFDIVFNLTNKNNINITTIVNSTKSGLYSYAFCFDTNQTDYSSEVVVQYANTSLGYSPRNYYAFNMTLSNITRYINLYLLNVSATLSKLTVVDINSNPVESVQILLQRYYIGQGIYTTVTQALTDSNGIGVTYLRPNDVFYQAIMLQDGNIVQSFAPQKFTVDSLGDITYTYQLGSGGTSDFFNYYQNVLGYSCVYTNTTGILRCTAVDTTSAGRIVTLDVDRIQRFTRTNVCTNSTTVTAIASIFTCNLTSTGLTNTTYAFNLFVTTPQGTQIPLISDTITFFTITAQSADNLLYAMMMFILLAGIGIYRPTISIILGCIALVLSSMLEWLIIPYSALISIFVVAAILIWQMNKSGS